MPGREGRHGPVKLEYGDGRVTVEVPDDSVVVSAEHTDHEPEPLADPVGATRAALDAGLGLGADR